MGGTTWSWGIVKMDEDAKPNLKIRIRYILAQFPQIPNQDVSTSSPSSSNIAALIKT